MVEISYSDLKKIMVDDLDNSNQNQASILNAFDNKSIISISPEKKYEEFYEMDNSYRRLRVGVTNAIINNTSLLKKILGSSDQVNGRNSLPAITDLSSAESAIIDKIVTKISTELNQLKCYSFSEINSGTFDYNISINGYLMNRIREIHISNVLQRALPDQKVMISSAYEDIHQKYDALVSNNNEDDLRVFIIDREIGNSGTSKKDSESYKISTKSDEAALGKIIPKDLGKWLKEKLDVDYNDEIMAVISAEEDGFYYIFNQKITTGRGGRNLLMKHLCCTA